MLNQWRIMQMNWMNHQWMNENIDTNYSYMTLNSVKKIYRERNREKKEVRKRM